MPAEYVAPIDMAAHDHLAARREGRSVLVAIPLKQLRSAAQLSGAYPALPRFGPRAAADATSRQRTWASSIGSRAVLSGQPGAGAGGLPEPSDLVSVVVIRRTSSLDASSDPEEVPMRGLLFPAVFGAMVVGCGAAPMTVYEYAVFRSKPVIEIEANTISIREALRAF